MTKPFLFFFFSSPLHTIYFFLYSHVLCNLLFMSTIHHTRPCVTSFLCPEIDVAGFYLTNWCTRRTWEEKVLMQQQQWSRGILLITRSANLIFQLRLGQRGSREVVVAEWGGGWQEGREVWEIPAKQKRAAYNGARRLTFPPSPIFYSTHLVIT